MLVDTYQFWINIALFAVVVTLIFFLWREKKKSSPIGDLQAKHAETIKQLKEQFEREKGIIASHAEQHLDTMVASAIQIKDSEKTSLQNLIADLKNRIEAIRTEQTTITRQESEGIIQNQKEQIGELNQKFLEARESHKIDLQQTRQIQSEETKKDLEESHAAMIEQLNEKHRRQLEGVRAQEAELALKEAKVELDNWKKKEEESIRKDAIKMSKQITIGKITEHIVPYLPNFKWNPKDVRFLGSPIDLIIFDGLDFELDELDEIVFVEVKTAGSVLTTKEQRIRDAIKAKRVAWVELRMSEVDGDISYKDTYRTYNNKKKADLNTASALVE